MFLLFEALRKAPVCGTPAVFTGAGFRYKIRASAPAAGRFWFYRRFRLFLGFCCHDQSPVYVLLITISGYRYPVFPSRHFWYRKRFSHPAQLPHTAGKSICSKKTILIAGSKMQNLFLMYKRCTPSPSKTSCCDAPKNTGYQMIKH